MGRFALAGVVVALWLSATASPASACPAGSPCPKYRRMEQTHKVEPEYFAREDAATVPKFDRRKLARFLVGSRWKPIFADEGGLAGHGIGHPSYVKYIKDTSKLHFVDPTTKIAPTRDSERVILIREIERNSDGDIFVDIDGIAYQLQYCVAKKSVPCLTPTGNSFDGMFP